MTLAAPVQPRASWSRRYPLAGVLLGAGAGAGGLLAVGLHTSSLVILGLAVALPMVYVALVEPLVALVVLVVIQWSNLSAVVGSHGGLSLYLLALAVGAISLILGARRAEGGVFPRSPIYLLVAIAALAEGLSLLATSYPLTSLSTPVEHLKDVAFFFIAIGLMQLSGRWGTALRAMVITVAVLAGLSLVQQYVLHNSFTFGGLENTVAADVGSATARHIGPESDPNFWGRTIVLATAPALAFLSIRLRSRRHRSLAVLWVLAVAALVGGEYLTQSRGGLIVMAVLLVLWVAIVAWRFRRWLILVPLGLALLFVAVPGISSRLGTLGELAHISSSSTDPSLQGRAQAQEAGLAMFESNPLTGVGAGNFQTVEPSFLDKPGVLDTGQVLAPHDLYLQIAAEQGIVGLGAWALLIGGAIFLALRAALLARRLADDQQRLIALGCLGGLLAWAGASVVLHLADLNDLLAVIAVVAIVDAGLRRRWAAIPKRQRIMAGADDGFTRRAPSLASWAAGAGVAVAFGCAAYGVTWVSPLSTTRYQAQATAAVRPVAAPASGDNAYAWNTVDRDTLFPTFANIIGSPRFVDSAERQLGLAPAQLRGVKVSSSGDVNSATLSVRVEADSPDVAHRLAATTLQNARQYLGSLVSIYEIEPVAEGGASAVTVWQPRGIALVAALGLLGLAGGRFVGRRVARRRRQVTRASPGTWSPAVA